MALIDNTALQYYASKMVKAENRKVGSKSLPEALADIDTKLDEMEALFDEEYGSSLDMTLENNENVFSVGTGSGVDKGSEVENSFSDISISGNSMVNLITGVEMLVDNNNLYATFINNVLTYRRKDGYSGVLAPSLICGFSTVNLKLSTTYTMIFNSLNSEFAIKIGNRKNGTNDINSDTKTVVTGINKFTFTTPSNTSVYYDNIVGLRIETPYPNDTVYTFSNFILLEGDWTNKPIPSYFTGLKSIGTETEDGKHKISILSRGKNLCPNIKIESNKGRINERTGWVYVDGSLNDNVYVSDYIKVKPNCTYSWTNHNLNKDGSLGVQSYAYYDVNKNFIYGFYNKYQHTLPSNCAYIRVTRDITKDFIVEEGTIISDYEPYKADKKEILLDAPLRSVGDVKDVIKDNTVIRKIGQRAYQAGDESLNNVITDMTTTNYILGNTTTEDIDFGSIQVWKNGAISIDEVLPVTTTHTVALSKSAQIKRNIEELTKLRDRVTSLEEFYSALALEQARSLSLVNTDIQVDYLSSLE